MQQQHVNDWLLIINQKFDACELTEPQRRKWAVAFLSDEALKWYTRQLIKFETWNDLQNALRDNFPSAPEPSQSLRHQHQILLSSTLHLHESIPYYHQLLFNKEIVVLRKPYTVIIAAIAIIPSDIVRNDHENVAELIRRSYISTFT
ncbi:unnamed protein product [Didymodactylos carnosus]|uniref:Retrotransposon gag domain-containing protein n=1 Tax=Didymodactylos carnosus TaxID=1234261 RepID=A0A815MW38_9BILA|nr:unnamed protein product [Didymodactylos carnosus]CAF4304448.1 unnamed protein product [Didymodactylos carnosus]